MISIVKPTPVTVGGAQWPVLFTFRAWWELTQRYGSLQGALEAARRLDQAMAAAFFWSGLLYDSPNLTPETVTAILDEGTFAELEALPAALVEAIKASQPDGRGGGSGDAWDWDVARAVWSTEWGQDPDRFWDLTFRDFASMSDGRSRLYEKSKREHGQGAPDGGWSLADLMQMNRGRR